MKNRLPLILIVCLFAACNGPDSSNIQTTLVMRGTFIEELTEEGTIQSVNATGIGIPRISYRYGSLKIASIVEDGKEVQKGDTILVLNPEEIQKAIIDAEQRVEIAKAEYEKLKATQESEIEDLEADLEIAKISQQISQINFDNAQFESDVKKKEIQLQLETAVISLERAEEQIINKKKIHVEELKQKSLTMRQLQTTLDEASAILDELFIVSPNDGIVSVKDNWMTGNKWSAGDQPYGGSPIIDLPDLSQLKTEVKINEVDISKIVPGLPVEIKSDAYSNSVYTGTVTHVANLAQPKDRNGKIKIFPVEIIIDGKENKLLPGLTVSCKIKVQEIPDVLYLPVESIFDEFGINYVYLRSGNGFKRKDIVTGAQNNDFVIIREGLSESDEVALQDPFLNKEEEAK